MEAKPYLVDIDKMPEGVIAIRTHDRMTFKRCRRKWSFISKIREYLEPLGDTKSYLWFGTGVHFALEDYHGYNRFGDPFKAFEAYMDCFKKEELSDAHLEAADLFEGMLIHYTKRWLPRRKEFNTLWIDGVPQVEVEFSIYIPELSDYAGRPVVYQGKFDRAVYDSDKKVWINDYKTAAQFDIQKLETDPQISAYSWAGDIVYNTEIAGMAYQQFKKAVPQEPKMLVRGGVSADKNQKTTYGQYLAVLQEVYGEANKFPEANQRLLDMLADTDKPEGDSFIRMDLVQRNKACKEAEYQKILDEGRDMLNDNISCYPNPTRDCYWDCGFRDVCLAMDDGSDWEYILSQEFRKRGDEEDWKSKIKWPEPQ